MLQKNTKIVATISDKNCSVEFLKKLYEAGMNVVRINTAHQSTKDSLRVIKNVKKVSEKIPILLSPTPANKIILSLYSIIPHGKITPI